jgi:acyl-CoA thioesterase FadM
MARVKLKFPDEKPLYTAHVPVRICDINYGNHLGNDALLSLMQEARMQLLAQWNYTELEAGGIGLIMADVMIAYKGEAFYGEVLKINMYIEELTSRSFDMLYQITTERNESVISIAHAKTGMVCYDYDLRRTTSMTGELKSRLQNMEI